MKKYEATVTSTVFIEETNGKIWIGSDNIESILKRVAEDAQKAFGGSFPATIKITLEDLSEPFTCSWNA